MLKALYRALSDALWKLGFEQWSMKLLLLSLEDVNVNVVTIDIENVPQPTEPKVVYENVEAVQQLGSLANTIAVPHSALDIN